MNTMLRELVEEIRADKAAYDEIMIPPATANDLSTLQARCKQELRYEVPTAYLELLSLADGIDCNGIMLYGSHTFQKLSYLLEGLVEANLLWRTYSPNQAFVFLAETGEVLYCHNLTTGKFEIVDRITTEIDDEATSFSSCE